MCGFATAVARIPVGIAYAIWAASGTAIMSLVGILFFGETFNAAKLVCLTAIMAGVVGLNLLDAHH